MSQRAIVLRDGAPNLNTLHMELRVRVPFAYDQQNYAYHTGGEIPQGVPGTLIGRPVEDILDAVNEERLMLPSGEVSFDEMLGIWDRSIREEGEVLDDAIEAQLPKGDYQKLFWEYVLVDDDGTVWSRTIEVHEGSLIDAEEENNGADPAG